MPGVAERVITKAELRDAFIAGYVKAMRRLRGVNGSEREMEIAFEAWWEEFTRRLPTDDTRARP